MIPVYSNQKIPDLSVKPSIFLAGPTPRSLDVPSWRPDALRILKETDFHGYVLVPEHQVRSEKSDYTDQVEWEWEGLENAKAIAFWVPRQLQTMPAFTTNVEFGSYIRSPRSTYGRPPFAHKCRYLDWRFFASHSVEVEWTEEVLGNKRYEDELVEDMLTLMSSFSNKIYGKRSAENRKKKKLEKLAALDQKVAVPVEEEAVVCQQN